VLTEAQAMALPLMVELKPLELRKVAIPEDPSVMEESPPVLKVTVAEVNWSCALDGPDIVTAKAVMATEFEPLLTVAPLELNTS
jgi:hypothetical protein